MFQDVYNIELPTATTFQRNPKPLYFEYAIPQFEEFKHKIIHRVLDETAARKIPKDDTWAYEQYSRNALFDQVLLSLTGEQAPSQGDVLIVGDIDEIPRLEILATLRNCAFPPRVTLRTQMYYYSFQWLHRGELWPHPQVTYFDSERTIKPQDLRLDPPDVELFMSGWHCSSCFRTMEGLKNKITSFSHKVYNHPYILNTEKLIEKIRLGQDIFERKSERYDRIDDNCDLPMYLRNEDMRQRFSYMLNRDPHNANFQDRF